MDEKLYKMELTKSQVEWVIHQDTIQRTHTEMNFKLENVNRIRRDFITAVAGILGYQPKLDEFGYGGDVVIENKRYCLDDIIDLLKSRIEK